MVLDWRRAAGRPAFTFREVRMTEADSLFVAATGETLRVAVRRLALPGRSCDIVLHADERDEITTAILEERWRLPEHYDLLRALGAAGGRVLDLGAHVGTFALFAASVGCRVLAVEASPRNAALLRASAERNGFRDLDVVETAVGAVPGTVRFVQAGPYGFVAGAHVGDPTVEVPVTTPDDVLAKAGWGGVEFVKMDIEGSEVAALKGMSRLLRGPAPPPVVFESNGHTLALLGQAPSDVRVILAEAGYRCYLLRAPALIPVEPADLQPECNVDYLALRPSMSDVPGWHIRPPMTDAERLALVLASCADDNPHVRAHIARALRTSGPDLVGRDEVRRALHALAADHSPDVRAAASWWARGVSAITT